MTEYNELSKHDSEIRRLYLTEKMTDAQVAAALPVETTGAGIASYRARNGIKGHRRGGKSTLDGHEEEIRRLYVEETLTDSAIAEKFDVTAEAVRRARIRWGIATTRQKATGRFSMDARFEEVKDQLPDAWERSKRWHSRQKRMMGSSARVAEQFGVGPMTAHKWLTRLGLVESRSVHGEDAPTKAIALFDEGRSVPAVAREMQVPEDTVRTWISKERDLSDAASRRSHEERQAFRRAVSAGKASSVAGSGRYDYHGVKLDSSYEVRFVMSCDRLGLAWRAYDREADGVLEVDIDGETVRYAPDLMVGALPVEVKGIFDRLAAAKVASWRSQRGKLAMVMRQELSDLEDAKSAEDVIAVLDAACYLTPPTDPAYWD